MDFKIQKSADSGRESADIWPEGPVYPKYLPKFFLSHKTKNWWFYPKTPNPPPPQFWPKLGGVRPENVANPDNHLTWSFYLRFLLMVFLFTSKTKQEKYQKITFDRTTFCHIWVLKNIKNYLYNPMRLEVYKIPSYNNWGTGLSLSLSLSLFFFKIIGVGVDFSNCECEAEDSFLIEMSKDGKTWSTIASFGEINVINGYESKIYMFGKKEGFKKMTR